MTHRREQIYQFTLPTPFLVGPVHVYLICGESLTLVDTGPLTKKAKEILENELKKLGFTFQDVERVVLTHHHPDHVGLTAQFPSALKIGHPYLKTWLQKNDSFFQRYQQFFDALYQENGVPADLIEKTVQSNSGYLKHTVKTDLDVCVTNGDDLTGLTGWKVFEVPGHAQTHILLMREVDRVAIGGDVLLSTISSNALLEPPMEERMERPKTLLQYRRSLKQIRELELKVLLPGHGDIITNVDELIEQRLQGHLKRAKVIKKLLANYRWTANQISSILFQEKHIKEPTLTFSETMGHLDLLLELGEINVTKEKGIYLYYNE
ncbi:MBL fold metallo-hydrolase [Halalkalibacter krulwichiae]|uniref:Hydroxyacylglutathione hydrolase n=1 Tax=Halalkalibacter krulwichiae TaxID=199441 RepID=A0A1X9M6A5_9BACI|nr:MBL fold metallo-hydrolase [Halalkalibacter krulwichiae]ARK28988.1 Hydroxyacylglutathione hydrolase [Halalkalibacter krulwichiae]